MSATRYYQVLNSLVDRPEALAADPMLVKLPAPAAGQPSEGPGRTSAGLRALDRPVTVGRMNERVPDSSGLPLRAMVMVLLFLGVIFLLVGFQAMSSDSEAGDETSALTVTSTTKPAAPKPDVRVYTVAGDGRGHPGRGPASRAGWTVTEAGAPLSAEIPATTVYFGTAEGEQAAAESVGKVLEAPVEPRIAVVAEQPPGVIVLVTG